MDPTLLDVVLLAGLTVRAVRLAVVDTIGDPVRAGFVAAAGRVSPRTGLWAADLWACPFCIGFWISAAVVASYLWAGGTLLWQAVAATATLSYLAGHAVARLDTEDDE